MEKQKPRPIAGNHSKLFFVVLGLAVILFYLVLARYIYQSYQEQRAEKETIVLNCQA